MVMVIFTGTIIHLQTTRKCGGKVAQKQSKPGAKLAKVVGKIPPSALRSTQPGLKRLVCFNINLWLALAQARIEPDMQMQQREQRL